jgi:NAD kinase
VVCADGRPCGFLQQGETVTVTYHAGCCPVLRMRTGDGFYARLGRKFGWGARG